MIGALLTTIGMLVVLGFFAALLLAALCWLSDRRDRLHTGRDPKWPLASSERITMRCGRCDRPLPGVSVLARCTYCPKPIRGRDPNRENV